jgi:hypothetical protein
MIFRCHVTEARYFNPIFRYLYYQHQFYFHLLTLNFLNFQKYSNFNNCFLKFKEFHFSLFLFLL